MVPAPHCWEGLTSGALWPARAQVLLELLVERDPGWTSVLPPKKSVFYRLQSKPGATHCPPQTFSASKPHSGCWQPLPQTLVWAPTVPCAAT